MWTSISDTRIHSGTDTTTLSNTNATHSNHNTRYTVIVYNASYVYNNDTSGEVV